MSTSNSPIFSSFLSSLVEVDTEAVVAMEADLHMELVVINERVISGAGQLVQPMRVVLMVLVPAGRVVLQGLVVWVGVVGLAVVVDCRTLGEDYTED